MYKKQTQIKQPTRQPEPELTEYEITEKNYKQWKKREYEKQFSFENRVKQEYARFCIWCRAYKNGEFTEENFKEYQKKEKPGLNFWIKKAIAETYFNYTFNFDYDKWKWTSQKNQ